MSDSMICHFPDPEDNSKRCDDLTVNLGIQRYKEDDKEKCRLLAVCSHHSSSETFNQVIPFDGRLRQNYDELSPQLGAKEISSDPERVKVIIRNLIAPRIPFFDF